jgi:hypothetical protein
MRALSGSTTIQRNALVVSRNRNNRSRMDAWACGGTDWVCLAKPGRYPPPAADSRARRAAAAAI